MWRVAKWLVIVLLLAAGAAGIYFGPRILRLSNIGAGYIAKQMCSCIFVAERGFDSCRSDMPPDMAPVRAAALEGSPGVEAWIPGIARRTARYSPGTGCTLD